MSSPVRVALIAEGKTDGIVLDAAISAILRNHPFVLTLLQPEDAAASAPFGQPRPGGWSGVYRWCREVVERSNRLRDDVVVGAYDVVILHLDADVAASTYEAAHIGDAPDPGNLPCDSGVCPPASATTDPLRAVLLGWAGEMDVPRGVVLCTPSKSTEAWVLASLYPQDAKRSGNGFECIPRPDRLLQAKPATERLVRSGKKDYERYRTRKDDLAAGWTTVAEFCSEAVRFSHNFRIAAAAEQAV